jgi:hypothetical protein
MSTKDGVTEQPAEEASKLAPHAKNGDLAGLLTSFVKASHEVDLVEFERQLRVAVRRASQLPPPNYCSAIQTEALAFLTYLRMRLEAALVHELGAGDQTLTALQSPVHAEALSKALELMRLSQELIQGWAQSTRHWSLAGMKQKARKKRGSENHMNEGYRKLVKSGVLPDVRTR